jgi:hypothetical protein
MKPTGFNGELVDDNVDAYGANFNTAQSAFLTLFRMLLGDFDIDWYRRSGREYLTIFAIFLFIICKSSMYICEFLIAWMRFSTSLFMNS